MLSPLVEKAPMVPFICSFLRLSPGPRLFVQMGCREHSQGRGGRAGGEAAGRPLALPPEPWPSGEPARLAVGSGSRRPAAPLVTGVFPQEAWAAPRQGFREEGFSNPREHHHTPTFPAAPLRLSLAGPPVPSSELRFRPLPSEAAAHLPRLGKSAPLESLSVQSECTAVRRLHPPPPSLIWEGRGTPASLVGRAFPPQGLCIHVSPAWNTAWLAPVDCPGFGLAQLFPRLLQPTSQCNLFRALTTS